MHGVGRQKAAEVVRWWMWAGMGWAGMGVTMGREGSWARRRHECGPSERTPWLRVPPCVSVNCYNNGTLAVRPDKHGHVTSGLRDKRGPSALVYICSAVCEDSALNFCTNSCKYRLTLGLTLLGFRRRLLLRAVLRCGSGLCFGFRVRCVR